MGTPDKDVIFSINQEDINQEEGNTILAGADNDQVTVGRNGGTVADGGSGTDRLILDWSAARTDGEYTWLGFSTYDTETATWQTFDDYTVHLSDLKAALASADTLRLDLSYRYGYDSWLEFKNFEQLELTATAGDDLLVHRASGRYDGQAETDTLYADFSTTTEAVLWDNRDPSVAQTLLDGSTVVNIERMLLATGSGNDVIKNTHANSGNDEIDTGAGDDTIEAGGGNDEIDTGAGDDTIDAGNDGGNIEAGDGNDQVTVGRNGGTVADGGSGTDRLILDWSAARADGEYTWLGFSTYDTETATWQTFDYYTVHLSDLKAVLASADTLRLDLSYRYGYDSWLEFKNFEQLELTATAGDDLLVHRASGRYDGQAETDTLYADFSTTTEAVLWDNRDPSVAQTLLDGSTVVNIERMLLATGSGNDVIKNTHANSGNDEIDTGAGDDTIEAGGGNDRIKGGSGTDTAVFSANFADYRIDTIEGGVSVSDLSGNGDGVDELYDVERLQFLDQTINLINHAPTASNRTISTKEDVARVLAVANFGFRDVDAGDSLQAVMLTSLPTAGSLKLNGTAVTVNQVVTVADLAAGKLIFTPAANANGSGYASFGFKVSDGTAFSTAAYRMTVDVGAVNDTPTASNRTISTKEDVARVLAVANFGFRDVDAGDSLQAVMLTSLPTAGSLKLNGTAVTVNQVVTVADLAAGKLIFTPAANANGSGYASFGFKVSDGTAVSTAAYSMTVNVTAVNDAPTASNRTVSTKEDVPKVLKVADFGFSDLDANDSLQAVKITSLPTAGSLKLNDTLVTVNQLVTAADILANKLIFIPAANANGSGYASIGFKVSDGKATSTATYSITIDVTLVRDDLILKGTSGNDTLTGDMIDLGSYDRLIGLAGNDSLFGLAGNDTLEGGAGNDILNGGKGSDRMIGGDGSDIYYVDNTGDVVSETNANASTGGIDSVYSSLTDYTLDPNVENGRILSTGTANLTGNQLNNLLKAGIGNNILTGGTGTDTVSYVVGATTEKTGVTLNLALTTAQETGGSGTDTLVGIENLIGSAYADKLTGNSGRNNLSGGVGNDILNGGAGNDILNGDTGNDTLNGGAGNDTLSGGAGKDILNGGAGNDILNGGTGIDIFRFDTALNAASNLDEINNFSVADDTIQLENAIFVKLKMPGTLSATNFRASIDGSAADNNDFILYDTDSGALFYDADGSGTASAIQFAIIGITPALTASDFIVT
ncbi:Hemolysin-type calcium-binding region [Allochromatium vinosum DSM 180]|uniref:Hemolysin-type calcium-binding region n=1 Tax=Allochromatium vinosum (strain ATCC 17899 / DSM 180 / NBRC 103801 / NCIMB 10441 / D) TaxID=572477 RepID=D3RRC1_ALLVD|nr:Hemolysin-type calcium-binding region [Allochromatium vinosum DSM 180]